MRLKKKSVQTNLLNALLLSSHFLFLLNYFRLVLEREREREADEEGGSGEDPDDVADDLSARLYGSYKVRNASGDGMARLWWNNVDEGDKTVDEGLLLDVIVRDG